MKRLAHFSDRLALLVGLGLTLIPGAAGGASIIINNGLAPPNPANVIADLAYSEDSVYARNVGCPPGWPSGSADDPCPTPGDPTEVEMVEGGVVRALFTYDSSALTIGGGRVYGSLNAYDSSTITINGGTVASGYMSSVDARGSSTVTLNAGTVKGYLGTRDSPTVTMRGGTVRDELYVNDSSTMTIEGESFMVDTGSGPVAVSYGGLSDPGGTLTGTLASGSLLDNEFCQQGGPCTGTITLVQVPASMSPLIANGLAPPNPDNVIDDATYSGGVYVRNVGCPASAADCSSPGAPTNVALVDGAEVSRLYARDSSSVTMSGGTVDYLLRAEESSSVMINGGILDYHLSARDSSTVTINGGTAAWLYVYDSATVTRNGGRLSPLYAYDSSTVTLSGGTGYMVYAYGSSSVTMNGGLLTGSLRADDSSTIAIEGEGFVVDPLGSDPVPAPYGDLSALIGTLTGTLASGDIIDNDFNQGGGAYTGTITLVEAPASMIPLIANGLTPPNPDNVIDDATYSGGVYVRNVGCPASAVDCASPGAPTEAALLEGGSVSRLYVRDSSSVTMSGGTVNYLLRAEESSAVTLNGGMMEQDIYAYDSSTVAMNGGTVGRIVQAVESSSVTMNGGRVELDLKAGNSSTVTMNDGTVAGRLYATGSSTVTMNGGTAGRLEAYGYSNLTMNGGTAERGLTASWSSTTTINGGTVGEVLAYADATVTINGGMLEAELWALDYVTITIEGQDFMIDSGSGPIPVPYADLSADTGTLTGTLASGDPIDCVFFQGNWNYWATGIITLAYAHTPAPVTFDWVSVGDPGNACDPQSDGCFGAVSHTFRISKYEVTNTQYAELLNAVAATDANGLYNPLMNDSSSGGITQMGESGSYTYLVRAGMGSKPVNFVSFYDSLRFVNWLHNGQPTGAQDNTTTEDGAYTLLGSNPAEVVRNPGARVFLTNEDEWYKAAYYDATSASYSDYPAAADAPTTCAAPSTTSNTANCAGAVGTVTDVGSYTGSPSPAGTFDQGGNVWERNESFDLASFRGMRGGNFGGTSDNLAASFRAGSDPTGESVGLGFRVATIAEDSQLPTLSPWSQLALAAVMIGTAIGVWRWRTA